MARSLDFIHSLSNYKPVVPALKPDGIPSEADLEEARGAWLRKARDQEMIAWAPRPPELNHYLSLLKQVQEEIEVTAKHNNTDSAIKLRTKAPESSIRENLGSCLGTGKQLLTCACGWKIVNFDGKVESLIVVR